MNSYDYGYEGYESEASWEQRRKEAREVIYRRKLPKWNGSSILTSHEQIDTYSNLIKSMLEAKGFVILGDGYNKSGEGFEHHVSYLDTYHRNIITQAPKNRALVFVLRLSCHRWPDTKEMALPSLAVSIIGEVSQEIDRDFVGPMPVWGFHNCGGSWGQSTERGAPHIRWAFGTSLETNDYGDGLPDPKKMVTVLRMAIRGAREYLPEAPLRSKHVYMGNNVDNSYCYSQGHTLSASHELFWQRAGKAKILAVVPGASFS